jgi:hypothetical protein
MRSFILMAFVALFAFVSALPITPSAPQLQKRAEQFRLEGLKEVSQIKPMPLQTWPWANLDQFDIAERLSNPSTDADSAELEPFLTHLNSKMHDLLSNLSFSRDDEDDFSGDVAPGSMESPQMLPKAAARQSLPERVYQSLCTLFHGGSSEDYGYEGKELEMRRPEGMKHWGAAH